MRLSPFFLTNGKPKAIAVKKVKAKSCFVACVYNALRYFTVRLKKQSFLQRTPKTKSFFVAVTAAVFVVTMPVVPVAVAIV